MKKLVFILFLVSASLNAQVLRTNPFYLPPVISGSSSTLLNDDLAYWDLDESGTTFTNSVGTGSATGSSTAQESTVKILGYSQAIDNDDYISYSPTNIYPTGVGYAFSCWVRFTSAPDYKNIFQINRSGGYAMTCYFITTSQLYFSGFNSSATEYTCLTTGVTFNNNTWYHIVVNVRSGSSIQIWVNGVDRSDSGGTFSGTWATPTTAYFGSDGGTDNFLGYIDEVGIWNRSLTSDEIGDLYNGGSGITHPFE